MDLYTEYQYESAEASHTSAYICPVVYLEIEKTAPPPRLRSNEPLRILDLGCGNGAFASTLAERGFHVVGVEPSSSGVAQARKAYPNVQFEEMSAYDDIASKLGKFDIVVSLEVIEHVMWPRRYADCVLSCLKPSGTALISTPFHGYWKNLALALSGKMDRHFTVLWDGGHIKFWSEATLSQLLHERGFKDIRFRRLGRIAPLAKSMLAIAKV